MYFFGHMVLFIHHLCNYDRFVLLSHLRKNSSAELLSDPDEMSKNLIVKA